MADKAKADDRAKADADKRRQELELHRTGRAVEGEGRTGEPAVPDPTQEEADNIKLGLPPDGVPPDPPVARTRDARPQANQAAPYKTR
jgi:hypothetical protein